MIACKNCETSFEGSFCPQCGQKYIDKRFTLKDSFFWAFHSIFNFDKGFLYTSLALVRKPGKVILEFLDGITVRYAHPFRFVFIWATISALIGVYTGTFEDTGLAVNEAMGMDQEGLERTKKMNQIMKNYMSFVIMIMIPFFSLSTYWMFRKAKLNYAEHLIINSFGQSSAILIGIPLTVAYVFYHDANVVGGINFAVGCFVISRVYRQTFQVSWLEAVLKYILGFFITIILFALAFVVFLIIYSILAKTIGFDNSFLPDKMPEPAQ